MIFGCPVTRGAVGPSEGAWPARLPAEVGWSLLGSGPLFTGGAAKQTVFIVAYSVPVFCCFVKKR